MKQFVYADNAATTQLSQKAYEGMVPYLLNEYGNASQLYSFARSPKIALRQARESIANCIGASPEEIYFTSCGTESDNWVVNGAEKQGMPIITSTIEHHAILRPCEQAKDEGCKVAYLPVSNSGVVLEAENTIRKFSSRGLMTVMTANNEIGTIQPIEELVKIAHERGWLFHTDAVQAVGHMPINVHDWEVDMLSASAHKFNGPKGIGFLYIRKGIRWPPFMKGGNQEKGCRAGTENVASIVGMAIALEENTCMMKQNLGNLRCMEKHLMDRLNNAGINYVRNGSPKHLLGNISLSFPNFEGEVLLHRLDLMGIYVSTGSACDSKNTQISHVLKAIGLNDVMAKGTIRISLGRFNTISDVDVLANGICQIVNI